MKKRFIYNVVKFLTAVSALCMSVEYYFFLLEYGNYYYIGDIVFWFLFSVIMIYESLYEIIAQLETL